MYSAEVLSQLRTLSWLLGEVQRLPAGNPQRLILTAQIEAVRGRLPLSILRYHDERVQKNLPSVSDLRGPACGNCQQELPPDTISELAIPGRFGVCPKCGVFIWSGNAVATSPQTTAAGPTATRRG
jgi:predicted  nucleic acid-binding Zn-ribbon protein